MKPGETIVVDGDPADCVKPMNYTTIHKTPFTVTSAMTAGSMVTGTASRHASTPDLLKPTNNYAINKKATKNSVTAMRASSPDLNATVLSVDGIPYGQPTKKWWQFWR